MSTIIDERVVEMRFDNKHFEQNVSTSMSSINKLKQSLDLSGASKGLSNISPAIGDTRKSLENLEYAAYKTGFRWGDVAHKISSVAEWRIARQAIDSVETGVKNLANSLLGLTAMKTGFSEYETQMGAIQTILANTEKEGTTLDDVNGALDELNSYADKTIYNFTEMTRNIGTFTAAGVKLDTSVQAIKGIANLAAVSGSTSQQASTAMYQLSQAMASGTVKLMDWNSVVNAGMGGQVFQDALKETARVHGIAIDDIIAKNGSFRESLSEGWLTTEILTDTLAKFTGDLSEEQLKSMGYTNEQIEGIMKLGKTANDAATKVKTFTQLMDTLKEAAQSGWAQTWRILFGDFEEAKELFTEVSEVIGGIIGRAAESRNELLENWKVLGGRTDLIESIRNIFNGLVSIITPIKEAFREIFPPTTAEQLRDFTKGIRDLTSRFKLSEKASNNLKRTFKGLFAVIDIVRQVIVGVFKVVGAVLSVTDDILGVVFSLTGGLGDLLVGFRDIISEGNLVDKLFSGIAYVVKTVLNVFTSIIKFVTKIFTFPGLELFAVLLDSIYERLTRVRESTDKFGDGFSSKFAKVAETIKNSPIIKFLGSVLKGLKTLLSGVFKALGNVLGEIGNKLATGDIMGIFDIIHEIIAGGIGIQLIRWIKGLGDSTKGISDIVDSVDDVLGSLSGALKGFQNSLNAAALKDLAIAIAILAGAVLVLSFIDSEKLTDASAAILVLFSGLMGSMAIMGKANGALDVLAMGKTLISLSVCILILAFALKKLSSLDMEEIGRGLLGVGGLMAALIVAMRVLQTSKETVVKGATQMIVVAYACKILAGVLKDLANLDWEELAIGTLGMTACMAVLVGAMKILPLGTKNIARPFWKFCAQLIVVAKAAGILADALIEMGYLDWDELAIGTLGMVGCMTVLVGAMKVLSTVGNSDITLTGGTTKKLSHDFIGMAAAIMALSFAIRIMAPAVKEFSSLNWTELGKAGVALGGILAFFSLFALTVKMVDSNGLRQASKSILIISAAMLLLSAACKVFATMSWESLAKGGAVLLSVVGMLMLLGLATKWLKPGTINAAAASLTILAAALNMLIPPLLVLSLMSWESLTKGASVLLSLVGALMLLGLATKWTNPGTIAVMAASMTILAAALNMLIPPLLVFSVIDWRALAIGGVVLAGLLTAMLALGGIAKVFKGLIPSIYIITKAIALFSLSIAALGIGLGALGIGLTLFSAGISAAGGAIVIVLRECTAALEVVVVGLVKILGKFLVSILQAVIDVAPRLAEAINSMILALCDVLVDGAVPLIETCLIVLGQILDQLIKYGPDLCDSIIEFVIVVLESVAKHIQPIVEVIVDILIAVFDGIASRAPELIESFLNIFIAVFNGLGAALKNVPSDVLLDAVLSFGAIALLMKTFASVSGFGPAALKGVLWAGLIFAEIAVLIAAIGVLAQLPGLTWLITEGGKVLAAVGTAIGMAIGGIIGGIAAGASLSLPIIATMLSQFMANIQPFVEGAKSIDSSVVAGVAYLCAAILLMTGAGMLTAWAAMSTLGLSILTFSLSAAALGSAIKKFSESTEGINTSNGIDAAKMALYLSAAILAMTAGGALAAFGAIATCGLSLVTFPLAAQALGLAISEFSKATEGVNASNIVTAAKAAGPLTNAILAMTGTSLLSAITTFVTGGWSLASFVLSAESIGWAITRFSEATSGVNPTTVTAAADAAGPLVDAVLAMTGTSVLTALSAVLTAGFTFATFALSVEELGWAITRFSEATSDVDPVTVTAAADAAGPLVKAVLAMTGTSVLTALSAVLTVGFSFATFALSIEELGWAITRFSKATSEVNPTTVTAAADAAGLVVKAVLAMTGTSLLTALTGVLTVGFSFATFAASVEEIGWSITKFSEATSGVNPTTVTAAADAAGPLVKAVLTMTGTSLLTALTGVLTVGLSFATFAASVEEIGWAIIKFSDVTSGVNPTTVTAAADAAGPLVKAVLAMTGTSLLTALTGILTCGLSFATFAASVEEIGWSITKFSEATSGVNPTTVTAAADAAGPLAKAVASMTGSGFLNGLANFLSGGNTNDNYRDSVVTIGKAINDFSKQLTNVDPAKVSAAADASVDIANVVKSLPSDTSNLVTFGDNLVTFGSKLNYYYSLAAKITKGSIDASTNAINAIKTLGEMDTSGLKSVSGAIDTVSASIKNLSKVPKDSLSSFTTELGSLGTKSVAKFKDAFDGLDTDLKKAGKAAMDEFAEGVNDKKSKVEKSGTKMAEACVDAINDKKKSFETAGKNLAQGLADGISANSYKAEAKAKAMAEAAVEAARKALDINSPSKVFRALGYSVPEGFAMGIDKFAWMASDSSIAMSDRALDSVKHGISRIADAVNSDIDTQPTIRPVLDLSDVKSGAGAISGMFGNKSLIGVSANIGSISGMMNQRNQNGGNAELVSAINALRKDMKNNTGTTNIINGVTYDDGSNINSAVESIVRAARIERRM